MAIGTGGGATSEVILSIDQGTTSSKATLVDSDGRVVGLGSAPTGVVSPQAGWVEQDARRIWDSVLEAIQDCFHNTGDPVDVVALTLSTQRESVVGWSASTGEPIAPVIGWQDRRTADWCARSLSATDAARVRAQTGLRVDPMFSAPKMRWMLDHLPPEVPRSDVRLGTVDSWLLWQLTGGGVHACEAGNASRTLLYDVAALAWSDALLDIFGIPAHVLPAVLPSDAVFGQTGGIPMLRDGLPIVAVMADSHAAMFGHGCTTVGMAKATYGTGSSVMTPVAGFVADSSPVPSTLAWLIKDGPMYAQEGNILSSGATLAWASTVLTGGRVADLVQLAETVPDSGGVAFVPAFSGLGAPYWDRDATALLTGMSNGTTAAHIARAAVDSVAHQICDVIDVIESGPTRLQLLHADGGMTVSDCVMQTQADLLGRPVHVSDVAEVSALGAALLGWRTLGHAPTGASASQPRTFDSRLDDDERTVRRAAWHRAVERARYSGASPTSPSR